MPAVPRAWNFRIDFVGRMGPILWTSLALTVASFALVATRGINLGTDFVGGYEIQVTLPGTAGEGEIREALAPLGLGDARVQRFGGEGERTFLIGVPADAATLSPETQAKVRDALTALAGGAESLTGFALAEGGERLTVGFAHEVTEAALREAVVGAGLAVRAVHRGERTDRPEYVVALAPVADGIAAALAKGFGLPSTDNLVSRVDFVGPQVGAQLRNDGLMAVFYSLALILLYVAVRFDLFFSPGAIIATLHDVVLTIGIFSILQIEFNLTTVAAILTLIGFSLNDTIVVYDRIRENVARNRGRALRPLVNDSINETLSRTILTSGTVLLVVAALLALGGPFIRSFAVTMFVGVIVGTYSSIAVASPLYILLRERYGPQPSPGIGGQRGRAAPAALRAS